MKYSNKRHVLLIYVILALATIIAYEPVRHNEFIECDDDIYVTENPHITDGINRQSVIWAFNTPYMGNWHPLTWLNHMLDCELFGLNPLFHHLTNLLLHIANTLLLFYVFNRMSGALWPSAFVAAVFALHPLHVESVAWVAERKDVLSGLFWMLTMIAYVRYVQRPGIGRYLLVVLSLCLGLMAKPMVATLPFVLLLLDYWPLARLNSTKFSKEDACPLPEMAKVTHQSYSARHLIAEKIPLLIPVVVVSIITYIAQQQIGAMIEDLPLKFRIANTLISYIGYIGKMIYPSRLAVLYPLPVNGLSAWQPIVSAVILVCISAVAIYLGRRYRYLTVGWLWYLGTLVPVIGLIQVGNQVMADRYTYLPSIGFFIMVAFSASELFGQWRYRKAVLAVTSGVVLAMLLACTRMHVSYWRNDFTLLQHTIAVTENNYVIHNNYGLVLRENGRTDEAFTQFSEALRINPRSPIVRINIGIEFLRQGRFDEAIIHLSEALRSRPDWGEVYYYLGLAYARQSKYEQAIKNYKESLRLKPDGLESMNNLAWLLSIAEDTKIRNPAEAVRLAERACELTKYEQPELLDTLAVAYAATGKFDKAIETAEKALTLAQSSQQDELIEQIRNRLDLYKAGQPYVESSQKAPAD